MEYFVHYPWVILIIWSVVFVWREQTNSLVSSESNRAHSLRLSKSNYEIRITSPAPDKIIRGPAGHIDADVSGTYKVKPPAGTYLRLFVRTYLGYWRQDAPIDYYQDGYWRSKIGLYKGGEEDPGYEASVIAVILDETGEELMLYSKKVHDEKHVEVSFSRLPRYIDKSEEVKIERR